ncbi:MAG: RluA family pseudouridine synthase [Eubacteriales bacterium]|nr:RluA family pseudouridine synthase [Eubacteriales bacterium]MDY3332760.1 RluA family pseudouridine synthase [Gallibacter sp.]
MENIENASVVNNLRDIKIIVVDSDIGTRLDKFIASHIPNISRSNIQKIIENGEVSIDGIIVNNKKYKVASGQQIELCVVDKQDDALPKPNNIRLNIVYEDEGIVVINKPFGMVVHPGAAKEEDTVVNALLYKYDQQLSDLNGVDRPGIVHRIDKDTSGLLVIAKNNEVHENLAKQLENHSMTREYYAVVYNNFLDNKGTIDLSIGRNQKNRLKKAVDLENGRHAVTHWEVLERFGKYTLIKCKLETGRTHQIRVHLTHINHPLVGDGLYGPSKNNLGVKRQMLHAKTLGFIHPITNEYIEFNSELPPDMQLLLEKLRGKK